MSCLAGSVVFRPPEWKRKMFDGLADYFRQVLAALNDFRLGIIQRALPEIDVVDGVGANLETQAVPRLDIRRLQHIESERVFRQVVRKGTVGADKTAVDERTSRNTEILHDGRAIREDIAVAIIKVDGDGRRREPFLGEDAIHEG